RKSGPGPRLTAEPPWSVAAPGHPCLRWFTPCAAGRPALLRRRLSSVPRGVSALHRLLVRVEVLRHPEQPLGVAGAPPFRGVAPLDHPRDGAEQARRARVVQDRGDASALFFIQTSLVPHAKYLLQKEGGARAPPPPGWSISTGPGSGTTPRR